MARDLSLRVELKLKGPAAHRRNGLDEADPQCALLVGEVVATLDDEAERAQQDVAGTIVRAT